MAYSFIMVHEGYPCVFWYDYYSLKEDGERELVLKFPGDLREQRTARIEVPRAQIVLIQPNRAGTEQTFPDCLQAFSRWG